MKTLLNMIEANRECLLTRMASYNETCDENPMIRNNWAGTIDGLIATIAIGDGNGDDQFWDSFDSLASNRQRFFENIGVQKYVETDFKYGISLGLLKYQKYCLLEMIEKGCIPQHKKNIYTKFINQYFDRIEMNIAGDWIVLNENEIIESQKLTIQALKDSVSLMGELINKTSMPYLLIDSELNILTANQPFIDLIVSHGFSGFHNLKTRTIMYGRDTTSIIKSLKDISVDKIIPWINHDLKYFCDNNEQETEYMKLLNSDEGMIDVSVSLKRMQICRDMICVTMKIGDE